MARHLPHLPAAIATSAAEARDEAIAWQHWASDGSMSLADALDWAHYFEQLGERFGLLDEFRENGLC